MTPEQVFSRLSRNGEVAFDQLIRHAKNRGDDKFFYYGETQTWLTFKEFAQKAISLGHGLAEIGVQKGDKVCVYGSNSLQCAIAMYGIWAAGGVYAALNFNLKGPLLDHQITCAEATVVIAEAGLVDNVYDSMLKNEIKNLIIFSGENAILGNAPDNIKCQVFEELTKGSSIEPFVELSYDDLAAIIFTSGTTGPAKGVLQHFRYISQYTMARETLTPEDVCYCDLPMYHVGGAFAQLARACWAGAQIAVWDKFSPTDFWNRVNTVGATSAVLLDVMIPWLLKMPPLESDQANTLNKVHMQPLPDNHNEVARRFGFDFVTTAYGATESGFVAACLFDELADGGGTPAHLYKGKTRQQIMDDSWIFGETIVDGTKEMPRGLMGRPIAIFELGILDDDDMPVQKGVSGQLVVRCKYPKMMLHSYFNNPEATINVNRDYWYHTGDDCYEGDDGLYFFNDRRGGHFRVRGENVSSYEVETGFAAHPAIFLAACIPVKAKEGNEEEIALFVQLEEGQAASESDLIDWAKKELPAYMRPKRIVFLDEIPVTPTNKMEKYKLEKMLKV